MTCEVSRSVCFLCDARILVSSMVYGSAQACVYVCMLWLNDDDGALSVFVCYLFSLLLFQQFLCVVGCTELWSVCRVPLAFVFSESGISCFLRFVNCVSAYIRPCIIKFATRFRRHFSSICNSDRFLSVVIIRYTRIRGSSTYRTASLVTVLCLCFSVVCVCGTRKGESTVFASVR